MIILPRQARDKHRENSKKDAVFRTGARLLTRLPTVQRRAPEIEGHRAVFWLPIFRSQPFGTVHIALRTHMKTKRAAVSSDRSCPARDYGTTARCIHVEHGISRLLYSTYRTVEGRVEKAGLV